MRPAIIQVLDEAQNSVVGHPKLTTTFTTLYEKTGDPAAFFEAFFPVFSNVLLVNKREPAAERVVTFVSNFVVTVSPAEDEESEDDDEKEPSLLDLLVGRLLTLHKAKDKSVRFLVCQVVAKLLSNAVAANRSVSSHRLDDIQEAMLQRLQDKIPVVRVHAVLAVEYLQSRGPNCPVTSALLDMMARDSSPDVRKCIINKIGLSDASIAAMIERTRDVKEAIRYSAFGWLTTKCSIKNFTISRRIQLLRNGLNDTSEMVLNGCVNGLLRAWTLESDGGNFINLLSRLDVESFTEVCELALVKLFDKLGLDELVISMSALLSVSSTAGSTTPLNSSLHTPCSWGSVTPSKETTPTPSEETRPSHEAESSDSKVLSDEYMGCEEVFYWSCLCRYLHTKGKEGEEGLEKLLPTLSEFCDYIQRYIVSEQEKQFITQQLCSMLAVFDLSDEVGRCRLCELLVLPQLGHSNGCDPSLKMKLPDDF